MEKQFKQIIFHSLVTSGCCILLGLVIYQGRVFVRTHYAFQFIALGLAGGIFFHTLRVLGVRIGLFVLVGLVLIQIVYNRSADFWWVLRDFIFGVSLGSAIYLFFVNYNARQKVQGVMTPITLGGLLAATNLVATIALVLVNGAPVFQSFPSILVNVMLGFLIGFGIGGGILISMKVFAHPAS
jgi:hypothetical protein